MKRACNGLCAEKEGIEHTPFWMNSSTKHSQWNSVLSCLFGATAIAAGPLEALDYLFFLNHGANLFPISNLVGSILLFLHQSIQPRVFV